jgi:hypothetical protein
LLFETLHPAFELQHLHV